MEVFDQDSHSAHLLDHPCDLEPLPPLVCRDEPSVLDVRKLDDLEHAADGCQPALLVDEAHAELFRPGEGRVWGYESLLNPVRWIPSGITKVLRRQTAFPANHTRIDSLVGWLEQRPPILCREWYRTHCR